MTRFCQFVFAIFGWFGGVFLIALGTVIAFLGIVGWAGVEIRLWTYHWVGSGIVFVLLGFILLWGVNSAIEEVQHE